MFKPNQSAEYRTISVKLPSGILSLCNHRTVTVRCTDKSRTISGRLSDGIRTDKSLRNLAPVLKCRTLNDRMAAVRSLLNPIRYPFGVHPGIIRPSGHRTAFIQVPAGDLPSRLRRPLGNRRMFWRQKCENFHRHAIGVRFGIGGFFTMSVTVSW